VAAAIGQPLNIPVLVRSLGQDMYRVGMIPDRVFRPGLELMIYLDGNLSSNGLDDPVLNVGLFHLPWWTSLQIPTSQSLYLCSTSLKLAIVHYRRRLAEALIPFGVPHIISNLADELNKPAYTWHSSVDDNFPNDSNHCTRCRLYRAVGVGVLDQLRDAYNMVHACETANEAERDIGIRRASGFNELYEAALKKESEAIPDSESASVESTPDSDSASVELLDQQSGSRSGKGKEKQFGPEVEALKDLTKDLVMMGGMASSKWTWGVDLTETDLLSLVRGADRQYELPHSGYDDELSGSLESKTSETLDPVDLEDPEDPNLHFDELSQSVTSILELRPHDFPNYSEIMILPNDDQIDPDPDPVIEAFTKRAKAGAIKAKKLLLQDEVDQPVSYANYGSEFLPQIALIPRRPWLIPRLPIILPPTNMAVIDNSPHLNIPDSDSSIPHFDIPDSDTNDDVMTTDAIPGHINIPKSPPSDIQFPVSDDKTNNAQMDVVSSDDMETPMSVVGSDSEPDLDGLLFPVSPTGVMVGIGRDPNTGLFTAASFANFPDEVLD
jgi:hypothetical protein